MIYRLLILLLALPCSADIFYVSSSGSNSSDGLSLGTAFETLQHAVSEVSAGDEVLVSDGVYRGFNISKSGNFSSPITFRALGENVVIDAPNDFTNRDGINVEGGDWIVIEGFRCSGLPRAGIRLVNADHCIVRNTHCLDNGKWGIFTGSTDDFLVENNVCGNSGDEHGIYISNSSDRSIVRNNRCFSNAGAGLQINADANFPGDGISSDPLIYNNIIYDNGSNGGSAINLDGVVGATVFNNLLYENHASGIALFRIDGAVGSSNARIYHNVIINSATGRSCLVVKNGSTGADVRNNIIFSPRSSKGVYDMDSTSRAGLTSDFNMIFDRFFLDGGQLDFDEWNNETGQDANSLLVSSLDGVFEDRANSDYRLASDSPAIGAATELSLPFLMTDLAGASRPQEGAPDLGPYEDVTFQLKSITLSSENLSFVLSELPAGKIVYLQRSSDLSGWNNVVSYQRDNSSMTRILLSGDFTPTLLEEQSDVFVTEDFIIASPHDYFRLAVFDQ